MCEPISATAALGYMAAATAAGAAVSVYQGEQSRKQTSKGNAQAAKNAAGTAQQGQEATNAANTKAPNAAALAAANQQAAAAGQGSTMLTGPAGIDLSQLTLGKTTLLGN